MQKAEPGQLPLILKKVKKTISGYGLIQENDTIITSVSGGPDSVFLVHALYLLKDILKIKLLCFHLDHKTRNGESALDAEFVKKYCSSLGLRLISYEVDAKKWSQENRLSFQDGARKLRLKLLNEAADASGAAKIATGHTASDNVETFILNLLRGTGLNGLSGIAPKNGNVIRPLIDLYRNEILRYLDKHEIKYRIDKTNIENKYARNRIRNLLVPYIRDNFSKDFEKKVSNAIRNLRDDNSFIEEAALQCLDEVTDKTILFKKSQTRRTKTAGDFTPEPLILNLEKLQKYPLPLIKRILISAVAAVKDSKTDLKSKNIEEMVRLSLEKNGPSKEIALADGLLAVKENKNLYFFKYPVISHPAPTHSGPTHPGSAHSGLTHPGVFRSYPQRTSPSAGASYKNRAKQRIKAAMQVDTGSLQEYKSMGIKVMTEIIEGGLEVIKGKKPKSNQAYLDYDCIGFPVIMKFWEGHGEKFFPLGLGGSKKLQDFFTDKKIPLGMRSSIPLFYDSRKLIWVAGYEIDDRVKLTAGTRKIFHIKIFKI